MKPDINSRQAQKVFIFKSKAGLPSQSREERELMNSLSEARKEWNDSVASFEHVYEENLVDYYTYKMKACEARYTYFLKKARECGLKTNF